VRAAMMPSVYSPEFGKAMRAAVMPSVYSPEFVKAMRAAVMPSVYSPGLREAIRAATMPSLIEVRESLRQLTLPSNLKSLPGVTSDDVLDFTLKHGVSLYLIPRPAIAKSLLSARDGPSVRRIVGERRSAILQDCRTVLENCSEQQTLAPRELALQSIEALENDLFAPAQALAANLLDSLVNQHLEPDLKLAAKRKVGESIQDVKVRVEELNAWQAYVVSALWAAFEHYFQSKGDPIPHTFSRHATVHAVGRKQYSRRSAVQGLMVVTSAIGYMNGLS
jgi:hypothetical protein